MNRWIFMTIIAFLTACNAVRNSNKYQSFNTLSLSQNTLPDSKLLTDIFAMHPDLFRVTNNKDAFRLQIIFTQIDRDKNNHPHFAHHFYHINEQYFYPASTVKFPVSVLALEKINRLHIPQLDRQTTMLTDSGYNGQSVVYNDPTTVNGKPSIGNYIKKIFLVSDNDAFNRLYEWLGQRALNERLHTLGFRRAQILHRLGIPLTEKQNRCTNPIRFVDTLGNTLFTQPLQHSNIQYQYRNDTLGKAYLTTSHFSGKDSLIEKPMDFSKKNSISLLYLHQLLQWIMFPKSQLRHNRLFLTQDDYAFLHKYMSMFAHENDYPYYDINTHWPARCKFLLMGGQRGNWPNDHMRIFNKVGDAYGFITDVSYIVDFETKTEFMLSCSMLCNQDGIFNDDKYDYQTIGLPFMKMLGEVLYEHEKKRCKKRLPNLNDFKIDYRKN